MSKKISIMIDGGHLRNRLKTSSLPVTADYIEKVSQFCREANEEVIRILYYDCAPFQGETKLPISKQKVQHNYAAPWLHELAQKDLFAIRLGVLKFRGYAIKKGHQPSHPPQDSDFIPKFEQKGVDMRIGLDMALFAANRSVDLIALMTGDTDCIPAMKYVRRAGIQVALIVLPGCKPAPELLIHADFRRPISWPLP
jgi:uncharacterized LabA/DUF88 family protein